MNVKRVFVIGAGFSKQVGMPLATELTPLLRQQFKECDHEEALTWLDWLDERVNWMNSRAGNGQHTPNIEELFDLAHFDALTWKMRQQMCPVGRGAGDTPYSTATSIEAWLSYMEDALQDVILRKQQEALKELSPINRFTAMLQGDDAVVTFNYDTLIEQSIFKAGRPWQYGFALKEGSGTPILKMHGSINWAVVLRNQAGNFGYPVLFRKKDQNVDAVNDKATDEIEYDYVLLRIPDNSLADRIENRILQLGNKQYGIGIAGLGRYKPLDQIPGTGEVWHNAGRALYQADEIYAIGFSLSPYDTMARLHFAGAMCERARQSRQPQKITLIDPFAGSLEANYRAVFGRQTPLEVIQKRAEEVDWAKLLSP